MDGARTRHRRGSRGTRLNGFRLRRAPDSRNAKSGSPTSKRRRPVPGRPSSRAWRPNMRGGTRRSFSEEAEDLIAKCNESKAIFRSSNGNKF